LPHVDGAPGKPRDPKEQNQDFSEGPLMPKVARKTLLLVLCAWASQVAVMAQISSFQHIILVVQENRTPDNLFYALCSPTSLCSTTPSSTQYNIQTSNWLDKTQSGGVIQPLTEELAGGYDLGHAHIHFGKECDLDTATNVCHMDGAAGTGCSGTCPSQPQFRYVDNSKDTITPYLQLVQQYGWANYMFQTNQGPSFPAHQFLFGATSAPSAADDAAGIFVESNMEHPQGTNGCTSKAGAFVLLITPPDNTNQQVFPCFEHNTLPDVMPSTVTWKYYSITNPDWEAPNAIQHICQPSKPTGGVCTGSDWIDNVDLSPKDILTDIADCKLRNLNWAIPISNNSDHNGLSQGGGPSWVASIVNAVGKSSCKNPDGSSYWDSTAILVTWDDWGGWYDHEPPTILAQPQGDYQYGFRVPLIVISAYTAAGYIDNQRHDFGSMVNFVEHNFGVQTGILGFADARAGTDDLSGFFNLSAAPRPFVTIPSIFTAEHFINDTSPELAPDTD
jgi:phospholipase C